MEDFLAQLVKTTKAVQGISAQDVPFYKASDPVLAAKFTDISNEILAVANLLLEYTCASSSVCGEIIQPSDSIDLTLEDVADNYGDVSEITDHLLEKANIYLDDALGKNNDTQSLIFDTKSKTPNSKYRTTNLLRPQLRFDEQIDNSNTPFIRKITHKPNALRALDCGMPGTPGITADMAVHMKTLGITNSSSSAFNLPHPYEYEISMIEYPAHMYEIRPEMMYDTLENTPFTWIETDADFEILLDHISTASEIAVDTEHHDYRSFQGLVCLIQISTRTQDFIIDALKLRSRIHLLNQVFTDPKVIKVLHGADSDIQWLQRDFGVYIVNMFDTYQASHALEMPSHGLSHLLQEYCGVTTDKKYQLADWRIRPLTPEMMLYAKMDTHYLLYIYDKMRNELIAREPQGLNLIRVTLEKSARTCLKTYQKEIYSSETGEGPGGWKNALQKFGRALSATQFEVYRSLHGWRDTIARKEDESVRFVMPNHMLFNLAIRTPLDAAGVLGCCNPPTPLIRLFANEIAGLIEQGVMNGSIKLKERDDIALENLKYPVQKLIEKDTFVNSSKHVRFDVIESAVDDMQVDIQVVSDSIMSMAMKRKIQHTIKIPMKRTTSLFLSCEEELDEDLRRSKAAAIGILKNLVLMPPAMINPVSEKDVRIKPLSAPVKEKSSKLIILSEKKSADGESNSIDLDDWIANKQAQIIEPIFKKPKIVEAFDYSTSQTQINNLFTEKTNSKDLRNSKKIFNPFVDKIDPDAKPEVKVKQPKLTNKPRSGNRTSTF